MSEQQQLSQSERAANLIREGEKLKQLSVLQQPKAAAQLIEDALHLVHDLAMEIDELKRKTAFVQ